MAAQQQTINQGQLMLNGLYIEVRASDGYVDLNKLSIAGSKKYTNWRQNKKTENFLNVLAANLSIPASELLKRMSGRNGERHTYGHPQVALNLAQWISPEFDVQVTKYMFELYTTGKVDLGNDKSSKELTALWKAKISKLKQAKDAELDAIHTELGSKNVQLIDYAMKIAEKDAQIERLKNFNAIIDENNLLYVASYSVYNGNCNELYVKVGKGSKRFGESDQEFIERLKNSADIPTAFKVHYLVYVRSNEFIETGLKSRFGNNLVLPRKEWLRGVTIDEAVEFIKSLCQCMTMDCAEVMHEVDDSFVYTKNADGGIEMTRRVQEPEYTPVFSDSESTIPDPVESSESEAPVKTKKRKIIIDTDSDSDEDDTPIIPKRFRKKL